MFKKVHLRLTLLCTGITAFIMIIMTLAYLHISENSLNHNQFTSFQTDMNNFVPNLEQQKVITHKWLTQLEHSNKYIIYLTDNGIPLLYNSLLSPAIEEERTILIKEALSSYGNELPSFDQLHSDTSDIGSITSGHDEFIFTSDSYQNDYYGCIAYVLKGKNTLQAVVVSPLDSLKSQIFDQRILFLIINLISFLVLTLFSWFFTWILLKPIEKNQKSQTEFISAASHELRTPLAVILSCTESYKHAGAEKRNSFVNTIQSESIRMSRLIEDMMTLTQSDSHRFSIHKTETELDTLLLNFSESFEAMAREKHLSLSVDLPKSSLPPCICDKDRIGQVIAILLHNAISYTPVYGHIRLSIRSKKDQFILCITDDGPGIADEDKDKVFDRFYRTEKSRSTKGHFGLGLCIAYEIVKAHQGFIKISDTPGGGTTFTVLLP